MTAESANRTAQGPLAGIKVLDLSRFIAGPYCSMMFADMGAEVIKIEKEGNGDPARLNPPFVDGVGLYALAFNRNKKGLSLDLRSAEGQEILRELASKADILVENFRPGIMEKMGCGWAELSARNPRLIMARISGFGQDGPYAMRPCFDIIAQAMSGLMDLSGMPDGPPTRAGTFITDYVTGMYAAIGVLAALNARQETGKGQVVDVALLDSAVSMLASAIPEQLVLGRTTQRQGNRDRYGAPSNAFKTADGDWIYVTAGAQPMYPRACKAIERPDLAEDPRFRAQTDRLTHVDELEAIFGQWIGTHTTNDVLAAFEKVDVPCSRIHTIQDVVENPQLRHRGQIADIPHPTRGSIPMQGVTIKMTDTPLSIHSGLPEIGEHTQSILGAWLGYEPDRIADLTHKGII